MNGKHNIVFLPVLSSYQNCAVVSQALCT